MTVFRDPYILLLAILPVAALAWRIYADHRRRNGIAYSNFAPLAGLWRRSTRLWLTGAPAVLKFAAILLIVAALARPQAGDEKQDTKRRGIDIFIALDVSGSMSAEDLKPDRITAARVLTGEFIKKMTDHRIGLVIFAGRSMTLCPLTIDIGVIVDFLSKVKTGEIPIDGTAIGDAIANCVYKFKDEKAKSRVIVLVTDGENNSGNIEPMVAAKLARDKKIKIYTIGIGSKEGAPVPVVQNGQKVYLRNYDGTLVIPKLDEKLLQEIAALTDGMYFRATDEKKLKEIYDLINKLERSEIVTTRYIDYTDQAHYPLFLAFCLLLSSFWLEYRFLRKI